MDTSTVAAALTKHKGKIAPAARELGCSRAWLHEQVNASAELTSQLADARNPGKDAVKKALDEVVIDPDEVGVRALEHDEGPHAATLAVIVEHVAAATGIAKRDVAKELGKPRYQKRLTALLPQAPDTGPKKVAPVAISLSQQAWLRGKAKGTVPSLLASVTAWPKVDKEAATPVLVHTSFLLPKSVHRALKNEAADQGASVSALVRAVLDHEMAKDAKAAPPQLSAAA